MHVYIHRSIVLYCLLLMNSLMAANEITLNVRLLVGTVDENIVDHVCLVDEGLQANIENCSVFPADVGGGIQHPLIINRCIVDQTVVWKDQGSATTTEAILGERFEFHFRNWWGEHTNIHLRCDLTV